MSYGNTLAERLESVKQEATEWNEGGMKPPVETPLETKNLQK